MEEIKTTVKYETHKAGSWVLCILSFVMGVALAILCHVQVGTYQIVVFSALLALCVVTLALIQMCYILTAGTVALAAMQMKLEEARQNRDEEKKKTEDMKYELSGKIVKVKVVSEES